MSEFMPALISLIVPCYNEEKALPSFWAETTAVTDRMDANFEFIFVDDGSRDGTLRILRELAASDSRVKYISFSRNFGKEAAMYAGFAQARGDYAAVMDADLQDPPSLLPELLRAVTQEGYDSAATRRVTRKGEPPIRSFFARMFYRIINRMSDVDIVDGARDFRLMKLIIFTDSGDTIIDEATQVFDDRGIVLEADFIPGAGEVLQQLHEAGFCIALVADGEWESFQNVYPNLWERVREKAKSGAFYPEGALWVESDTNIPSGESLIRQFVRGKRWFRRELEVESELAWMPDTFGFSPALPQIMRKCQVPYFATQKLTRQDPEAEPFPYNVFWWEGLDGSRVLAHLFKKNNAVFRPADLITRWEEDRVQQEGISGLMFPFGYGDGGGGPTREMVETLRRCADLEGAPRCHTEPPTEFFRRALAEGVENVYRGELYLAWHRGTYTAQARTKRGIRKAETALKLAEYHLARLLYAGKPLKPEWQEKLEALWELLLFNQFHDIAPGSSIARVHAQAEAELAQVERDCGELLRQMLGEPSGMVAYNHLGWPRTYRGTLIPAQGSALIGESPVANAATVEYLPEENCYELKNARLICRVNPSGELTSLRIAGENREYLAGTGNRFLMYKDVNTCYDAWELGSMYEQLPVALEPDARIHIKKNRTVRRWWWSGCSTIPP